MSGDVVENQNFPKQPSGTNGNDENKKVNGDKPSTEVKSTEKKETEMYCPYYAKCISGFAVSLISLGLFILLVRKSLYDKIILSQLSLKDNNTKQFGYWKETPIPMFFELYLFNWTNYDKFDNGKKWTIEPEFEELGPYVFAEHHSRVNITFNENNTVSFNTIRTWHFVPEKSNGSLKDNITTLNTIALTVGNMVKHKSSLIRKVVSFLFEEKRIPFTVTKTAREFLFDGYNDTLLNILKKMDLKGVDIPFDKFGWFVDRNGSSSYDGNYTMNTGADDIRKLGIITRWNQSPTVPEYPSYCGMVNGTTGELWYPVENDKKITIFISDICSSLTLEANGSATAFGLKGNLYEQTPQLLDNGTAYPDMKCFSPGESLPSGVRNISQCKFGAPAFMSMPHFYQSDPSYRKAIKGMNPDPKIHNFFLALEPNTGLPLKVHASLQVNLYVAKIEGIKLFQNVKTTMMPVLWFRQHAAITEDLATLAKTILILPSATTYSGYGIMGFGIFLISLIPLLACFRKWKITPDEVPLIDP